MVLCLEVGFTLKDGTRIPKESNTAFINYPLVSLFSEMRLYLNETLVTPQSQNYNYKCYFETLLNLGSDEKDTYMQTAGYYEVQKNRSYFGKNLVLKTNFIF